MIVLIYGAGVYSFLRIICNTQILKCCFVPRHVEITFSFKSSTINDCSSRDQNSVGEDSDQEQWKRYTEERQRERENRWTVCGLTISSEIKRVRFVSPSAFLLYRQRKRTAHYSWNDEPSSFASTLLLVLCEAAKGNNDVCCLHLLASFQPISQLTSNLRFNFLIPRIYRHLPYKSIVYNVQFHSALMQCYW